MKTELSKSNILSNLTWMWHFRAPSCFGEDDCEHSFYECLDQGVLCLDREFRIHFANSTFQRGTGWESSKILGKSVLEIVGREDQDLFKDGFRDLSAHSPQWKSEIRVLDFSGNSRVMEFEIIYRKNFEAYAILMKEVFSDELLHIGSQKVFEMLENISDGFFCVDRNWKITYMNKSAEKVSQKDRLELMGKHLWDEYPDMMGTYIHSKYLEAMRSGRAVRFEGYLPQFDAWFETNLFPSSEGLSVYFRDVTESKKHREELSEYAERLKQTNDELEQFAHIASHDLKEPLRMISSFVHLLKQDYEGKLGSEANEFIHYITQGANRLQQMIGDLLIYSRSTRAEKLDSTVKLDDVLSSVLKKLETDISGLNANIKIDPLPEIEGNFEQLEILFFNLIQNSIKFRKENEAPSVHISSSSDKTHYTICLSDEGIGFDVQYASKIFQIFQKLQSRDAFPGSGIGLAIAKKIVERHSGRIWVESEKAKGAKFFLSFPLPLQKKQDFSDLCRKLDI